MARFLSWLEHKLFDRYDHWLNEVPNEPEGSDAEDTQ